MPEFFTNRDPFLPEVQHLLDVGLILPLPRMDPDDGSSIIVNYCSSHVNPNVCTLQDHTKLNYMVTDMLLREDDHAVINGIKWVLYGKDLNLKYVVQMSLSFLKESAQVTEKGFPFKNMGICLTHCPPPFVFALKLLFSKKISERVQYIRHPCCLKRIIISLVVTREMYPKISEELKLSAKLKLNEVESRIEDDVTHIRNWMEKQPHLNFKIDDQLILSFLRCCKFSLERTKEKIDNHYTMKTIMPEIFSNRDPFLPEMQHLLDAGAIIPLPRLHPDNGSRIILNYYNNKINPNRCTILDMFKLNYIMSDILLWEDNHAVINGITWVAYYKDVNIKHILQVTPQFVKKLVYISEKGLAFRILGLCLTHCPTSLQFIYDLSKLLFSKKIGERLSMVTEEKMSGLLLEKPYMLPMELGGDNGSINDLTVIWKKKVESYKEAILADEKLKTNESLRTGPNAFFDSNSIEGSFRQLTVD